MNNLISDLRSAAGFGFLLLLPLKKGTTNAMNQCYRSYRVYLVVILTTFLFLCSSTLVAQKAPRKSSKVAVTTLNSRQIADKIAKSLVLVTTQDINGKPLALGSGFFYGVPPTLLAKKTGDYWDDLSRRFGIGVPTLNQKPGSSTSSFIVSNLHVFKRAWTGKVKVVGSATEYSIKRIVGIDINHDLCVFEVDGLALPALMLADLEKLGVGDDIYVGGSPRGLENTLSRGIISGIRKDDGLVQIDAAISAGSSGGPVVDTNGNIVGVAVSSLSSGQNLNFAVAGSYVLKLRLTWDASVKETGAFAISDAEDDGFVGRVKLVKVKVAEKEDPDTDLYSITPKPKDTYLFNEDGNHLEVITHSPDGKIYSIFQTSYDYRGMRSRVSVLSQERMPVERSYTDTQNLQIKLEQRYYGISKESEFAAKNGLMVKETATYDRNGNLTERMRRASNGSYSQTLFEYNEQDRCISEKDIRDGKPFATTRYQYKLDAYGNWISQLALVDIGHDIEPIANKLILREISYY